MDTFQAALELAPYLAGGYIILATAAVFLLGVGVGAAIRLGLVGFLCGVVLLAVLSLPTEPIPALVVLAISLPIALRALLGVLQEARRRQGGAPAQQNHSSDPTGGK